MQTEQRLMALVADGHNGAFDELDRRHRDALTRYIRQLIHSDAEDIAQQSLMRAYDAIIAGTDIRSFRNWTWRVATNLAITQLRKVASVELPDVPMQQTVADVARTRETLQQLLQKIDQLPERQRAAVVLNSIEGKEVAEIAVLMEQQPNATSQLLHRARTSLRVIMSILFPLWFIKWILPTTTAQAAGWTGAGIAGTSAGVAATGSSIPLIGGVAGAVATKLGIGVLVVAGAGGVATVQRTHHSSSPPMAHAASKSSNKQVSSPHPLSARRPTTRTTHDRPTTIRTSAPKRSSIAQTLQPPHNKHQQARRGANVAQHKRSHQQDSPDQERKRLTDKEHHRRHDDTRQDDGQRGRTFPSNQSTQRDRVRSHDRKKEQPLMTPADNRDDEHNDRSGSPDNNRNRDSHRGNDDNTPDSEVNNNEQTGHGRNGQPSDNSEDYSETDIDNDEHTGEE